MIHNLQILRALAALSVVYLHVVSDAGLNLGIGVGNFGVDLFFVISGFTISYVGHMPAGQFLLRRLVRIVPLYWGASFGTYLIALLAPGKIQSASADVSHFVHSLLFLPYPNKLGQLLPTLALGWTLNYEMYFYALFTLALLLSIRWAPVLTILFLFVVGTTIRLSGTGSQELLFYTKPIVLEFALGIGVFYLVQSERLKEFIVARATVAKRVLIVGAGLGAIALPLQELYSTTDRALSAGPPAFMLVLSMILLEKYFAIASKQRWLMLLGDASYVLYLIHPYVLYGLIRTLLNPAGMNTLELAAAILLLPAVATLVAVAIHVFLERPVLDWLRDCLIRRNKVPAPAAA